MIVGLYGLSLCLLMPLVASVNSITELT